MSHICGGCGAAGQKTGLKRERERERERLKGETESGGWNGLEKGRRKGVTHHVLVCLLSGSVAVLKIVTWEVEKLAMVYPP